MKKLNPSSCRAVVGMALLLWSVGLMGCSEMSAIKSAPAGEQTNSMIEEGGEESNPAGNQPPSSPPEVLPPAGASPSEPSYTVGPLEVKDGPLMGRYMNVEALATRATAQNIQQCIYVNTCVAKAGFGPCLSISASTYDVTKDPMCPTTPVATPAPATPPPSMPTPLPTPVATPPPPAATPPPPAPTPLPPTSGPYPMPSSCFGLDLRSVDFKDEQFYFSFSPGTGFVTKFRTGNIPGDVYGGRFSTAHDNAAFTTIISERPCDIQEAIQLKLFGFYNISTTHYFVVADPATGVKEKAIAGGDKYTVWLKPNTTYYAVSVYAQVDQRGAVVSLPEAPGYYFRQGHSNNPGTRNMLPTNIRELLP